jgi:hypothetical protein
MKNTYGILMYEIAQGAGQILTAIAITNCELNVINLSQTKQ